MESRNSKLHRSDMEMNMPRRWGFSSVDVGGYNDVAPPELKSGTCAAAPTAALIQQQWSWVARKSRAPIHDVRSAAHQENPSSCPSPRPTGRGDSRRMVGYPRVSSVSPYVFSAAMVIALCFVSLLGCGRKEKASPAANQPENWEQQEAR